MMFLGPRDAAVFYPSLGLVVEEKQVTSMWSFLYVFQSFESLLSMTRPIEKNNIVWFVFGGVWWNPFVFGVNLEGLGMVSRLMDFANIPSNPASQNHHRWGSWKMLNHQRGSDVWLGFARLCCFFLLLCFFLFFFVCWCSSCSCDDFLVWSRSSRDT